MHCSVEAEPLRLNLSRYTVHADDVCVTIVGANVGDVGRVPATFYREWFVNFRFPGHDLHALADVAQLGGDDARAERAIDR